MRIVITLSLLGLALAAESPVEGQAAPGRTDSIASATDAALSYATFVPSSYRAGTPTPLVLIMDPRGNALGPLSRLEPAAERLGYLLMSSYDTQSDGSNEPNIRAVGAMIDDAQDLFTVDARRLYFVGFSGTARVAWMFAEQLRPYTAGIIGFGAGLPGAGQLVSLATAGPVTFSFVGGAGDLDFNYEEVRGLDRNLDEYDIAHRMEFYPGPHAWPPEEVFTRALEWLDVQAARSGWIERSDSALQAAYRHDLVHASELEQSGDIEGAWRTLHSSAETFDGLLDTREADAGLARLGATDQLERDRRRLEREAEERGHFSRAVSQWLLRVRDGGGARDVDRGFDELELGELLETSERADEPHEAKAARRMLASVYAYVSFYQPRDYMEREAYDVAAAFYRLSLRVRPDDARACLGLARASAQDGDEEEAMEALACVVRSGAVPSSTLREDPLLAPLRDHEDFETLMSRRTGPHPTL